MMSQIINCTIVENTAGQQGGGVNDGHTVHNSIVSQNLLVPSNVPNNIENSSEIRYSCAPELAHGTDGNITNSPAFIDLTGGDFRLTSSSPCIDQGLSAYALSLPVDLDGKTRILNIRVDMGAYEFQPSSTNNAVHLKARLQYSPNLKDWSNMGDAMEWFLPADETNGFFRANLELMD